MVLMVLMTLSPVLRRLLTPVLVPRRWLREWWFLRRENALERSGWYDPGARSDSPAVLIGGSPRSGTTLLRELLDRHPSFACGVETAMLVPGFDTHRIAERWQVDRREIDRLVSECRTLVEMADRFYGEMAVRRGKPRWVDKAPWNCRALPQLLTWFPRGRFLHVVRDGRDVVSSLRSHPRQVLHRGRVRAISTCRPIDECSITWHHETGLGLAYQDHPRCLQVRYERLVSAPQEELRRICRFLGEQYEPAMLTPDPTAVDTALAARFLNNANAAAAPSSARIGRWRHELTRAERRTVCNLAGELLITLGYTTDHGWVDYSP